jgi:HD-GYP domain-containing protein (c-di-GMP phosphodiesterase class II)
VRIVQLAADAVLFNRLGGIDGALAMARQRAGTMHDPELVERFCHDAATILRREEISSVWDTVLATEPGPRPLVEAAQLDAAAEAIGNAVDLKSPYLTGHSQGVGRLAALAAARCGLPEAEVAAMRRAGMLHDLGRIGVSAAIWAKAGPLSDDEWERVRLHTYYTERVLARPKALAGLGALAALHHERLDGSGYHRGLPGNLLSIGARILAAADSYQAMIEVRPYRPAHTPEAAAAELRREVRIGRLDGDAVNAVLAAAGHRTRAARRAWAAGLSDREVEVLRLVARGLSNNQIGARLSVSPRTVQHHLEHIFDKAGVSTRAAATYFAMQHHLLTDADTDTDEK